MDPILTTKRYTINGTLFLPISTPQHTHVLCESSYWPTAAGKDRKQKYCTVMDIRAFFKSSSKAAASGDKKTVKDAKLGGKLGGPAKSMRKENAPVNSVQKGIVDVDALDVPKKSPGKVCVEQRGEASPRSKPKISKKSESKDTTSPVKSKSLARSSTLHAPSTGIKRKSSPEAPSRPDEAKGKSKASLKKSKSVSPTSASATASASADMTDPEAAKKATAVAENKKRFYAMKQRGAAGATPSSLGARPRPEGADGCLVGKIFVFTGVLSYLTREDASDVVKIYGGKVTGSVSGRTTYVVTGSVLEDGRPPEEGKKYKSALERGVKILQEDEFFDLINKTKPGGGGSSSRSSSNPTADALRSALEGDGEDEEEKPMPKPQQQPRKTISALPTIKKKSSISGSTSSSSSSSTSSSSSKPSSSSKAAIGQDGSSLWTDKYRPARTEDLVGNAQEVRKLTDWLRQWRDVHIKGTVKPKYDKKVFMGAKAALVSGPPGVGKTSAVTLVARQMGLEVLELNASDERTKGAMDRVFADATTTKTLSFGGTQKPVKHRVVVMDEVDGMGAGDRGGLAQLVQLLKKTKTPVICICNERQDPKMKTLAASCLDLRFSRPTKLQIKKRIAKVCQLEGMQVEDNALEAIIESVGGDIRQVLNVMQMWNKRVRLSKSSSSSGGNARVSYMDVKKRLGDVAKDEVLRMSGFDAATQLFNSKEGFQKRYEMFFVDYSLVPLLVQQNYIRTMERRLPPTTANTNTPEALKTTCDVLDQIASAAEDISSGDLVDQYLHRMQRWELLPTLAGLTVSASTGLGFLGFPQFSEWFGKNSTTGKNARMLHSLTTHLNSRVSADSTSLRLDYMQPLRAAVMRPMLQSEASGVEASISLMDEYGLGRDDVFETLPAFALSSSKASGGGGEKGALTSKTKSAFTRTYNKGSHRSQALVSEVLASTTFKKVAPAAGDKAKPKGKRKAAGSSSADSKGKGKGKAAATKKRKT